MFGSVLTKVFGSRNQRLVKQMGKIVSQINALEEEYAGLDDDGLKAKTEEFKQRVKEGGIPGCAHGRSLCLNAGCV